MSLKENGIIKSTGIAEQALPLNGGNDHGRLKAPKKFKSGRPKGGLNQPKPKS